MRADTCFFFFFGCLMLLVYRDVQVFCEFNSEESCGKCFFCVVFVVVGAFVSFAVFLRFWIGSGKWEVEVSFNDT